MKILNLGCGTKICDKSGVINIDWSIYLRLKKKIFSPIVPLFLKGERLIKFNSLPANILVHNLAKGLPFETASVDVVYHSHLLEHLDKNVAEKFLIEIKRVLRLGGINRIVVPDFEKACRDYIAHIAFCEKSPDESDNHDTYIDRLLQQSVRKEAYGTSQQSPLRRFVENFILGDARRRGETHQWMYDRISLESKLINLGYKEVYIQKYNTSLIRNWNEYALDIDENSKQYKPGSLYVEAVK